MDSTEDWFDDCLDSAAEPCIPRDHHMTRLDDSIMEGECIKTGMQNYRRRSKSHSTPLTLKWLEDNYEIAEGVCIPRCTLYVHYLDFCEKNDSQPINAASFGKIIRQQFPHLTTRRLGTRGQSKYHYYGIGVKECSQYYDVSFSRKGMQSQPDGKRGNVKQIVAYSPRSKLGTLLPDFPSVTDFQLPETVQEDKVSTFLMMYRTHCQRILDTVIRANFEEVQNFLLHFWQGMPPHIIPILSSTTIVNLVGVCDSILYNAISGVLMPTVLQALPESLTQVIRKFAKQLDDWLHIALDSLPENLQKIKYDLARRFAQVLRRQTSLNHLCQATRSVIQNAEITAQMLEDWYHIDLNGICKQTLYTMDGYSEKDHNNIITLYREFEQLLEDQAPIQMYTQWLDSMIYRCVTQRSIRSPGSVRRIARQFLLMWSCFGTRVIRDMTLHSAPSFSSFHLLHLMFDDYVLYLVESLHQQERANDLLCVLRGQELPADADEELILPNPSIDNPNLTSITASIAASVTSSENNQSDCSMKMTSSRESVITDGRHLFVNSPPSAYSGSSPSHRTSSPITNTNQYDARINMTSLSSPSNHTPPAVNTHLTQEQSPEEKYMFNRYHNNNTGLTDDLQNYDYTSYNGAVQSDYTSRDVTVSTDWTEYHRGYQTAAHVTSGTLPYYNSYPHPAAGGRGIDGVDYHASAVTPSMYSAGYDASMYAANTCTALPGRHAALPHQNSGTHTGIYAGQYDDTASLATAVNTGNVLGIYGTNNNNNNSQRKRKLLDDASGLEENNVLKRMAPSNELMYSALTTAGGYPRA